MKHICLKSWGIAFAIIGWSLFSMAQQTNTSYFMQELPNKSVHNPALQSVYDFYFDLPSLYISVGNNSFDFNDLIFHKEGQTMTLWDRNASTKRNKFYETLQSPVWMHADLSTNIGGFGFRIKKHFFTFNISEKSLNRVSLPKDLFHFLLYGNAKKGEDGEFDFGQLYMQSTIYAEAALGYNCKINEQLSAGFKLKYLVGHANTNLRFDKFKLNLNEDKWIINAEGNLNTSLPLFTIKNKQGESTFSNIYWSDIKTKQDNITQQSIIRDALYSSNRGSGLDLGVAYKIFPNFQISASITDLGFIYWKGNETRLHVAEYSFEGIEDPDEIKQSLNSIKDSLQDAFQANNRPRNYIGFLSPQLNIGGEYSICKDKISFGIFSTTLFAKKVFPDLTASVNFRPWHWFNQTISYSILDGNFNNIGLGTQLNLGALNIYMAVEKIPIGKITSKYYIPLHLKEINVQLGIALAFGSPNSKRKKDSVLVGVPDYLDKYPNSPEGIPVDEDGCPVDSDKDGVPGYLDKCPNSPEGTPVDEDGCPKIKDEEKQIIQKALGDIKFKPGKEIIEPISYQALDNIVTILQANPTYLLMLSGHTDNTGSPKRNLILSEQRANAVKYYLMTRGINSKRIIAEGLGDTQPIAPNDTPEGRNKNRRVDFIITFIYIKDRILFK